MMPDVQMQLDLLQQQVKRIEREILNIRAQVAKVTPSANPPRPFESLRGIWEGVVFNEDDLQVSRWTLPEGL